uniref:Uncharacterized protein n=1 Tax=Ditylenchus dipsaci TaxID=166011 RepID=A0A915DTT2_9BILA
MHFLSALLLFANIWPFYITTTAIDQVYEGDEAQKMLFLRMTEAIEKFQTPDFEKISNVLVMPSLQKAVEDADLQGFSDFLQELSSRELQQLSQLFCRPRQDWSVSEVTRALGEGDNWVWFPKTVKFGWYGWSFANWMMSISEKYQAKLSLETLNHGYMPFGKREFTSMDLEFVRAVCVKQFSSFADRIFINESESTATKDNFLRNILGSLKGEDWKNVRNIVTPAFNSAKLRKVIPTFNESVKKSFFIFDQHALSGQKMDIEKIIRQIGMDIIGQAGFSADVRAFKESESPFIKIQKTYLITFLQDGSHLFSPFSHI